MEIEGATVVVTGASSGIGAATARAFADAGAKVVLAARNVDALGRIVEEVGEARALAVRTDVTVKKEVDALIGRAVDRFGRVDVMVNNAGVGLATPIPELDPADMEHALAVNVMGPLHGLQAAARAMRETGGGTIVNVSSGTSRIFEPRLGGAYPAMKRMLEILSDYARAQLEADHIRVMVVLPYIIATRFFENALGDRSGLAAAHGGRIPNLPPPDPPAKVAAAIVDGVREERDEVRLAPERARGD